MNKLLEIALTQYGIKEIVGSNNNKKIVSYFQEIGFKQISEDETPWCSALINWCAMKSGYERTNKLNARSWLDVGEKIELDSVQLEDILIFKRGNDGVSGHVTMYINRVHDNLYGLGGNQSNMVNIQPYDKKDLLGIRRLKKLT